MRRRPFIPYYPVALNLSGRLVAVVGGGKVAERKINKLLRAKARIKVISPVITPALKRLVSKKKITWVCRSVRSRDLRASTLVIAAASNSAVNKSVSRWSENGKIWANVVDDPELSDFISPASFRKGKAVISVHTDGKDPVLSRDLKNFLKEEWDDFLSYRRKS
ncbi:MAG: bifunctional precorrin-2 dehydrogenase/sirohydrochlorin ferrochelatase [Candidatus Omnitrophica bacterium]|nr:bifunctional precorrin-2 dehydrogenase/sirohydrochlorin ferrochelatase [Candidatus Omnitrophota bacterium]MDD5552284.1 bifunctional precorrin-2 dehydrogenase/sirohydrochlorin ferrochelatase [Candidatus Omnitrophota bacterium]